MDPQEPAHDPHADKLAGMGEAEKERLMCEMIFNNATAIYRDDDDGQAFSNQFLNDSGDGAQNIEDVVDDDDDNVEDEEVPSRTNSANVYLKSLFTQQLICIALTNESLFSRLGALRNS